MTISTPVKIVALGALAIMLGLGGLVLLHRPASQSASTPAVTPPVAHTAHVVVKTTPRAAHTPKPALHLDPGLPAAVRGALEKRAVAVVAIYSSRNATDRSVLTEARAGAHEAHASFVAANIARESIAVGIERWSSQTNVPAVLVVRRPGTIVFAVSGVTDRATVMQAATTSR